MPTISTRGGILFAGFFWCVAFHEIQGVADKSLLQNWDKLEVGLIFFGGDHRVNGPFLIFEKTAGEQTLLSYIRNNNPRVREKRDLGHVGKEELTALLSKLREFEVTVRASQKAWKDSHAAKVREHNRAPSMGVVSGRMCISTTSTGKTESHEYFIGEIEFIEIYKGFLEAVILRHQRD